MQFQTVVQILNHKFVGNHASDHAAFEAIECFIKRKDISNAMRVDAYRHMVIKGMGLTCSYNEAWGEVEDIVAADESSNTSASIR